MGESVVKQVSSKYIGEILMLESKHILKIDK